MFNIIFVSRHVGILEITENKLFKINKVKLKTVRPFYMEDVVLKDTSIDPTQEDVMMAFLVDKVGVIFSQAYHDSQDIHEAMNNYCPGVMFLPFRYQCTPNGNFT